MSKNPIAETFAKEKRSKAEMYRAKACSCDYPEAKNMWNKMAALCEEHAFVFEVSTL